MYGEIIKYFRKHITYSLITSYSGYRSIKKYKHGFAGPLYIPADDVEDIDTPWRKPFSPTCCISVKPGFIPSALIQDLQTSPG